MPRTRKHKYKRKICNSRRSIAMNKRKMKTKTKSKSRSRRGGTRKIFKKSHKRYTKNGMKRRIQKGGVKDREYRFLMESYKYPESEDSQTAVKMLFGNKNMSETNYNKFKTLLEERDKLQPNLWLTLIGIQDKFDTDTAFDIKNSSSYGFTQGKWIELVKNMRRIISSRVSADTEYAQDLKWRLNRLDDRPQGAHLQKGRDMKDLAADLQVEDVLDIIKYSRGNKSREVVIDLAKTQFGQPHTAIQAPISESLILNTSEFVEPLKTYLGYRLSAGRQGSNDVRDKSGEIIRFNDKMKEINQELQRTLDKPPGNHLYTLLTQKDLIPVYFEKGGSKDDSVPDSSSECKTSAISGREFTFFNRKRHCRTCGRCIDKSDTTEYGNTENRLLNPVCIGCYNLFSGVLPHGPGGSAASLSSASAAQ